MSEQALEARPKKRGGRKPADDNGGRTYFVGPNDTVVHTADLYAEVSSGRATQATIAKRFGLSDSEISRRFAEAGFPPLKRGRRPAMVTE
ncbi:hypothetical protein [Azospirillum himalayense]|uniref:Helix-turn-helix domain-containing protein n=1 Tax=Azospirillum himalayense TaxID=654847 RepID=A0ABW0GFI2_9PROT